VAAPNPASPAPQLNNDALDLGNAALVPVLKRVIPVLVGVAFVGVVIWWVARRRR